MFLNSLGQNDIKDEGVVIMAKRKDQDPRSNLTTTQEVLYSSEFKRADKAGGYTDGNRRRK